MLRAEVRASNSSFFARFSINELTSGLNFSAEIGIADRLLCHEIDAAGEQELELLGGVEGSACGGCRGVPGSPFDEEVEIAGGLEAIRHSRPEEIEALDAVAPAEIRERCTVSLDQLHHKILPS